MLQVKNLVKHYTTKGETVTALDHVSVNFPEKGMVFLIGKSGSGKSTLLNVSGGLDTPDDGEIIVKGKSSKDFTPSDFDSYRNTYVGFIFQEYNILNELTVAENVSLALELQGKECDEAHVNELLRRVDLEGYGSRRPNTLSGGQKQRVAIARALVKNPEIIMGDEPTGALDSATGKQVLDTLKKLSEEKLVVIVSHDRDFAEAYADRIIELKDGKIISDMSRGAGEVKAENVNEVSEKKLSIMSGATLTEEEEKKVLAFLKRTKGSIVISSEKEDVEQVPVKNSYVAFEETKEEAPSDTEDKSAFIKSKFPTRYAVKMGISGLKFKPWRLLFTTLLATLAFIVFGVFSTMVTYDVGKVGAAALNESTYSAAVLKKYGVAHMKNGDKEYTMRICTGVDSAHFSNGEIEEIKEAYPRMNFMPAYTFNLGSLNYYSNLSAQKNSDYYSYLRTFTAFVEAGNIKHYLDEGNSPVMHLVAGQYPVKDGECLISTTVYETFAYYGYLEGDTVINLSSYNDMVGRKITIPAGSGVAPLVLYVTGIIETNEDFSQYELLKNGVRASGMTNTEYNDLQRAFANAFTYSMASYCYVADGYYEAHKSVDAYLTQGGYSGNMWSALRIILSNGYFVSSNFLVPSNTFWISHMINPKAEEAGSYCQYLVASLKEDGAYKSKTLMNLDGLENKELDIDYAAPYSFMLDVRSNMETFNQIYAILGVAAGVLAVFAALLLFNFISASINAKKKDIGILRAVGARGTDVFKIFIVEAFAITVFCFILGSLGGFLACSITNSTLIAKGIVTYQLFYFDWLNVLIVFAIAFVTAVVSTAIPVKLTVKMKPVEAIRAL